MAQIAFPQFESEYDVYKMRQLVETLERQFANIQQGGEASSGGGAGGEHNDLTGRDAPNAHPTSAITGLDAALAQFTSDIAANLSAINVNSGLIAVNDSRITALETGVTLAQRIDDTTSSTVFYFGEANPGTLNADNVWRIRRITFITPGEDDVDVEWADGNANFDNVWDDRLILAYS